MTKVSLLRLPTLDGLLAFEAAARHGTFERAADNLFVTGGAIAKRVGALEQLLGVQLLNRSGRTLTPTAIGLEYLEQIRGPLHSLINVPLHRGVGDNRQPLRVYSPPTFARQIIMPNLGEFSTNHPHVDLELILLAPNSGPVNDADIRVQGGDPVRLGGVVLMADVVTPLAAPALLERLPPIRMPEDLASAPLVRSPLVSWVPWFQAAGLRWSEPAQGPKLVDLGLALEAAASGQGIALGSPALARPWLKSGSLVPLFRRITCPALPYCLLSHSANGTAEAFARWLKGVCDRAVREASEYISDFN